MARIAIPQTVAEWNERGRDSLPGHLGIEILAVEPDSVRARMRVERKLTAWGNFLHAGAVVSLADTCCGYATLRNLPEDAVNFTTILVSRGSYKPLNLISLQGRIKETTAIWLIVFSLLLAVVFSLKVGANLSRGAKTSDQDDEEDDDAASISIPRFLGRQNNQ